MTTDASDADLVARSLRSDRAAFGSLVERHQRLVVGVALARCGDPALAEDVAQDAFVAAWRDLGRLRDADRVGSWVAGIARNLAAGAVRRDGRRAVAVEVGADEVAAPSTPEDEALRREDRELLARALADVPAPHRAALTLYYLDGQSVAEIASALRVRDDVVKQRLSRGRRALRESVERRLDAALDRSRSRSHAAVSVGTVGKVSSMTAKQKIVAAIAAALAIGGAATWYATRDRATAAPVVARGSADPVAHAPVPPSVPAAAPDAVETPRARKLQPAERTALLAQIRAAQQQRTAGISHAGGGGSGPAPSLEEPTMDRAYIRTQVREIIPLLLDCYNDGLERVPGMAGKLTVNFTIEGEPGIGGVIGSSEIVDEKTTITDAQTRECMQETMYAVAIDPPKDGGIVSVTYPFEFRPN